MSFLDTVRQVKSYLEEQGRVSLSALKLEFDLTDLRLESLIAELVDVQRVAIRNGKILSWTGSSAVEASATEFETGLALQNSSQPAESPQAQRRQLTVLFCDLVDSTRLAADLDPEEWRRVVRSYQGAAAEVVEQLGGYVAQYLGDGILVYFGHPRADEDDPLRAVNTALGILDSLSSVNEGLAESVPAMSEHTLRVRIGIHTGPVVVGEMGGGATREQLAMGDSVNLAARLLSVAEPGWIVISAATRHLIQGFFFLEELGEKSLKGIPNPVSVARVIQASGFQTRFEVATEFGLTPLVGREHELALLQDHWEPVVEGHGQAVLLSGEAGMGKSRLVKQLREQLKEQRVTWLECRCSPYHASSALYPVLGLLEAGFLFSQDDLPEQKIVKMEGALQAAGFSLSDVVPLFATLLSVPLPDRYVPSQLSSEAQRKATLESLVGWLLAVSIEQPVALVMEDLHWSDPSTLELLGMLIEQVSSARILLLFTFRPDFAPPWTPRSRPLHVTLSSLTRKQTRAMIDRITGGKPLPELVVDQLVSKTDGVPLYIEELTQSVLESDWLRETDQRFERTDPLPELAVPSTLQDSLMARLDRLGSAKEVAQLASVLGREFCHELLVAAAPMDSLTLENGLQELARAELLHRRGVPPQAVYSFKHALIQDTAYNSLLRATRRQFHLRVAIALKERFPDQAASEPEVVARHYEEAGRADEAIAYYLEAGERATQRSATAEAVSHLRRGVDLLEQLPAGADRDQRELLLCVALGGPLVAAQGYSSPEVAATYERARELCQVIDDAPQLPRALYGLSTYYIARADLDPAIEVAQQLVELGERSGEPRVLVMGHLAMGVASYWQGNPRRTLGHLEQTMAIYDPVEHRDLAYIYGQNPDLFSRSLSSWTLFLLGEPDRSLQRAALNVELARKSGHAFSLAFSLAYGAVVHQMRGDRSNTIAWAKEAISLSETHGFPVPLGVGRVLLGWALADSAVGGKPLEEVQQGLVQLAGAETTVGAPYTLCLLAETQQQLGQIEEALATLQGALALSAQTKQAFWDSGLLRLRGELLLRGDSSEDNDAEASFRTSVEVARQQGARSLELCSATSLARFLHTKGRGNEGHALLAPVYECFTEGFDTQILKDAKTVLEELH